VSHCHHHPEPTDYSTPLIIGVLLNLGFVIIEAAMGFWSGSLALLADAGHNISDVLGLLLALGAVFLAKRKPTTRRTYGYGRATILAALGSSLLLMISLGGIVWEATQRFSAPVEVDGVIVMIVAGIGVLINTATAMLFFRGSHHDLNIKGAFLHMAADALVSLGVVFVGLGVWYSNWLWLDPVVSLVVAAVIAYGSWGLLRDSFDLAVDAAPKDIDLAAIQQHLLAKPGVETYHDLHVWALSTQQNALTVHLVMPEANAEDTFLEELAAELEHDFKINHATIQIERGEGHCRSHACTES